MSALTQLTDLPNDIVRSRMGTSLDEQRSPATKKYYCRLGLSLDADDNAEGDECSICLNPLTPATSCTLPCSHVFHIECVEELRKFRALNKNRIKEIKSMCPLCRTELPPDPSKLFDAGARLYFIIDAQVESGCVTWGSLSREQLKSLEEVARFWRAAADQGHSEAAYNLGALFQAGRGVRQSDSDAARWFRQSSLHGRSRAMGSGLSTGAWSHLLGRATTPSCLPELLRMPVVLMNVKSRRKLYAQTLSPSIFNTSSKGFGAGPEKKVLHWSFLQDLHRR